MLIPEHKFLVEKVFQVDETKDKKHKFQRIILKKPGYTDELGEKIGKDDFFECRAWNKKLNEIPVLKSGDKVKALLALQGTCHLDITNGQEFYYTQFTIRKIQLL